ncbi:MAG: leucine-rich repeat protein, partial [Abditibacteriota bacterium]|nr:leucine-rich repeat protein [Abditibacteriota bacterium]
YDELNVDPLVYIHSFVEAVSELGKINEKLENRARIAANKLAMQEIFDRLENMKHYAGNVTGDMDNQLDKLRHKIYTGKTDVIIDKNDAEALAEKPEQPAAGETIEPDAKANREVMARMTGVIESVNPGPSDNDMRDFRKTWKKVSENLRTGLIETGRQEQRSQSEKGKSDFETEGSVLKAYNGKSAKVEIPKGITVIGADAFSGCKEVVSVKLSASVKEIRPYAFSNCKNLTSFFVDAKNPFFSQNMGILYNKDKTALICYPSNDKTKYKKSLPSSLTQICEGAFAYCRNLETLTLSENITDIHRAAFTHCYNLKIQAPEGSAAYEYAKRFNLLKKDNKTESPAEAAGEKDTEDMGFYFRDIETVTPAAGASDTEVSNTEAAEAGAPVAETEEQAAVNTEAAESAPAQDAPAEEEAPAEAAEEPVSASEPTEEAAPEPRAESEAAPETKEQPKSPDSKTDTDAKKKSDREQSGYTIRSNTKTLRQGTFRGQKPRKSVLIGENILKIEANAFDELTGLKAIMVKKESAGFCSVDGVLYSADKKTLIRYPIDKNNVKYSVEPQTRNIASHAFAGCGRLKSVHLPDGDVSIAPDAFDPDTEIRLKNAKQGTSAHAFAKEKGLL